MPQLSGPTDPAADARWPEVEPRKGFFTDTSICIGCKACEVACKEWNSNPQDGNLELLGSSYDNSGALGASTWRHVAFIEQKRDRIEEARNTGRTLIDLGLPGVGPPADTAIPDTAIPDTAIPDTAIPDTAIPDTAEFRWLISSDVCKHCTHAGCLDVCPTGALFRTEFGTVVVQADVCNGCGTCVAGCPFGVIERRRDGTVTPKTDRDQQSERGRQNGAQQDGAQRDGAQRDGAQRDGAQPKPEVPNVGVAQKCTLCYDRLLDDQIPACAKTCPTTSIKFGDRADMVALARERVAQLHAQGRTEARLYGANDLDGVGGTGSVFLLLDEPEVYGLPPDPRVPTADLPRLFNRAGLAAAGMIAATVLSFIGRRS